MQQSKCQHVKLSSNKICSKKHFEDCILEFLATQCRQPEIKAQKMTPTYSAWTNLRRQGIKI
jgi:hypothetical protein